jgi:hypothetical protein
MSPAPASWTLVPLLIDQALRLATISDTFRADLELHAHVFAFLAGQGAADRDAHILRLQDLHDPRQRRPDGIGAIAGLAQRGLDQGFSVHGCPGLIWRRALCAVN